MTETTHRNALPYAPGGAHRASGSPSATSYTPESFEEDQGVYEVLVEGFEERSFEIWQPAVWYWLKCKFWSLPLFDRRRRDGAGPGGIERRNRR